ncbi:MULTISPECIES: proteophosphoglycan ppg4 [unclassified Acidovorax]|uniref:proteophosphoglycan ppg4 n=1 Tax=unclassified Acidovorax TaxID=2684926 RepID=UPI001C4817E2|nr:MULTISPECIES: proteophosphoglycan ppg4 [unclassified Acidovorax]MBV7462065.1 proteophosphoglycan ppg4 [Acidovorax sp. sif0632]MBV7467216.1 proteophosphoglycan ppg4 [Acidovorax sp. sif0613]
MTASNTLKTLLAGLAAVAVVGTAMAQGTPPTTASPNAATGAGQQSSQGTPMGTTGVGGGGAATATTQAAPAPAAAAPVTTDRTMSGSGGATTRPMRADRN